MKLAQPQRSACIVLLALACGLAASARAQDSIKIGVITDMTGTAKFYAETVTQASILATKLINEKGGVLGRKLELLIEDDNNKPDISAAKARKLVDEGVVFLLSNSSTTATMQVQSVSLETKTPQLTASNAGETMTTAMNNPYFWQTAPLASYQLATLMAYAKGKNLKKVALWRDNTVLSQQVSDSFKKGLTDRGIEIVAEEVIAQGATTAVPQLQKVRASNPDAVFNAAILGAEMVQFFRGYQQLGLKAPIMASYNLAIPGYLQTAKGLMEGVVFVDAYDPEKPETKAFIEAWKKEFGRAPHSTNGYGFDGVNLIADVLRRAGSTDKEKVRAAMQATRNWVGVMGARDTSISFTDTSRAGFNPEGTVVRVIQNNDHGPVIHVGTK